MIRLHNITGRAALRAAALLWVGLALASCVKEKVPPCLTDVPTPPPVEERTFKVKLTHEQTDVPIGAADMKRALIYIFDEESRQDGIEVTDILYAVMSIDDPVFDREYDTGLVLPKGGYEIIVWINPDAPYSVYPGQTKEAFENKTKADGRVTLSLPENRTITETLPFQLWGGVLYSVVEPGELISDDPALDVVTVPIYLNNYIITMRTEGLPADEDNYTFRVADNNGYYDFEDNYVEAEEFYYEAQATFSATTRAEDDVLSASITTLKIGDGRHPDLSLRNTTSDKVIFPANDQQLHDLMALIENTNANADFNNIHRYDILLDFTDGTTDGMTDMIPEIWINGWKVVQEEFVVSR